jgi:hypothetical protein
MTGWAIQCGRCGVIERMPTEAYEALGRPKPEDGGWRREPDGGWACDDCVSSAPGAVLLAP